MPKNKRGGKRFSISASVIENAPYLNYEQRIIGEISSEYLGEYADKVSTKEVIITSPIIKHIYDDHPEDFDRLMEGMDETLNRPTYVFEDIKDKDTLLFVRELEKDNQKAVIKLSTSNSKQHPLNSVISSYIIDTKEDLAKLIKRNKIIYRRR